MERSPEVEDYTLNFEESVISSHTATDDEIDFRMILPSESHRRRSLGATGRRGSIGSDQGTVSYSSVSDIRFFVERVLCKNCFVAVLQCLVLVNHEFDGLHFFSFFSFLLG